MKCHQRIIREQHSNNPLPDEHLMIEAASSMKNAYVREISRKEAEAVILKYEWLGNMGTSARYFGLFFVHPETKVEYIGGVNCFGHPGTPAISEICGKEHSDKVYWLARGACVHWAHPHSGSFLTSQACKLFGAPWKTRDGKDMPAKFVFVATADSDAGEIGTIYSSCNWIYVGKTTSDRMFLQDGQPVERAKSYRALIKMAIRNRAGRVEQPDIDGRRYFLIDGVKYYCGDMLPDGSYMGGSDKNPHRIPERYGKTMKEAEAIRLKEVLANGWKEIKGNPKHMYVGIYGDKRLRRELTAALLKNKKQYPYPYPKREK